MSLSPLSWKTTDNKCWEGFNVTYWFWHEPVKGFLTHDLCSCSSCYSLVSVAAKLFLYTCTTLAELSISAQHGEGEGERTSAYSMSAFLSFFIFEIPFGCYSFNSKAQQWARMWNSLNVVEISQCLSFQFSLPSSLWRWEENEKNLVRDEREETTALQSTALQLSRDLPLTFLCVPSVFMHVYRCTQQCACTVTAPSLHHFS